NAVARPCRVLATAYLCELLHYCQVVKHVHFLSAAPLPGRVVVSVQGVAHHFVCFVASASGLFQGVQAPLADSVFLVAIETAMLVQGAITHFLHEADEGVGGGLKVVHGALLCCPVAGADCHQKAPHAMLSDGPVSGA